MKRFLCLSLCLGIMASACRLDITQKFKDTNVTVTDDSQDSHINRTQPDQTPPDKTPLINQQVPSPGKQKVLEACLPQINDLLTRYYHKPWINPEDYFKQPPIRYGKKQFFLRRNWVDDIHIPSDGTAASPIVILYTSTGMPLEYNPELAGLGFHPSEVVANLRAMAASPVIQNQFIARENNAPGWRVHISTQEPGPLPGLGKIAIPAAKAGEAPVSPSPGLIIYDPEAIAAANVEAPEVKINIRYEIDVGANTRRNDTEARWYDCVVDEKTQNVTVKERKTAWWV